MLYIVTISRFVRTVLKFDVADSPVGPSFVPTVILSSIGYLGVSDVTLNVFSNTPFMNRSMSLSL
jgi:hypothetical protein